MNAKILVVDDDPDIVTMLCDRLDALGYQTVSAPDGQKALDLVEQETPRLMLLDLEMPRVAGIDVLKRLAPLRKTGYDLPVIVMTAHGTVHAAVEAMKQGAYDFLTKPFDPDHLKIVIEKALERESLTRQVASLQDDVAARYAHIVAKSGAMTSIIAMAQRAANSDAGVLLLGESGTGKELFARSVHQWSPRRSMPFVVINCVALTESLLENELFGHEKGAFTGADRMQKGKIEMADGGTVFLDEIGDMPMNLQASLLRVLQDHEFHRVGGTRMVKVNIRIIAATNKDLKQAVTAGKFREDLYIPAQRGDTDAPAAPRAARRYPRAGRVLPATIRRRNQETRLATLSRRAQSLARLWVAGERARTAKRAGAGRGAVGRPSDRDGGLGAQCRFGGQGRRDGSRPPLPRLRGGPQETHHPPGAHAGGREPNTRGAGARAPTHLSRAPHQTDGAQVNRLMPTRAVIVLLAVAHVLTAGCSRAMAPGQPPVVPAALRHPADDHLRLQWLGTSSWILSRGQDVVVVDPFFTRPSIWRVIGSLLGADFRPDESRIKAVLPALPDSTRFVLLGHAHYDHVMDLGYYLRASSPRPQYVGSRTAYNILRGWNPSSLDFLIADDPARLGRPIRAGKVTVTPLLSSHAPHLLGLTFMNGEVAEPRAGPPEDAWDYKLGRTLNFIVDFLGEQDEIVSRLFINGAAHDPEVVQAIPDEVLSRHPVDVAILCVPGWDKVTDYPTRLLDRLQPKQLVLSHYDDFFQPYLHAEDPKRDMEFVMFARYAEFVEALRAYYAGRPTAVPVIEPKTGDTICVTC